MKSLLVWCDQVQDEQVGIALNTLPRGASVPRIKVRWSIHLCSEIEFTQGLRGSMRAVTRLIQKMSSYIEIVILILLTWAAFYDVNVMIIIICSTYLRTWEFVGLSLAEKEGRKALIKCTLLCGWTLTLYEESHEAIRIWMDLNLHLQIPNVQICKARMPSGVTE